MNKDKANIEKFLNYYGESIPVPTELLVNPLYNAAGDRTIQRLGHDSAILYGALKLILKKESDEDESDKDENGNVYVTITGDEIADIVGTTTSSAPTKMIKILEKFGLIERMSTKKGQPYKLYVKDIKR